MELVQFLSETAQKKFQYKSENITRDSTNRSQNDGFNYLITFNLHNQDQHNTTEGTDPLGTVEVHHGCPSFVIAVWLMALAIAPAMAIYPTAVINAAGRNTGAASTAPLSAVNSRPMFRIFRKNLGVGSCTR